MKKRKQSRSKAKRRIAAKPARTSKSAKKGKHRKKSIRGYDPRYEAGLKFMRNGDTLALAARKIGVSSVELRRYVLKTGVVARRNRKWVFKRDRRFRRMPIYTNGKREVITVRDLKTARLIGEYMSAVRQFFETEDIDFLAPFRGQSVIDVSRKRYIFETRPNVLFFLDASGVEPFELVYAIVKPE